MRGGGGADGGREDALQAELDDVRTEAARLTEELTAAREALDRSAERVERERGHASRLQRLRSAKSSRWRKRR